MVCVSAMEMFQNCLILLAVIHQLSWDFVSSDKVSCPYINLPNGRVRLRSKGRLANFKCRKNFERVGHKFAVCLDSGLWSQQAPSCVGTNCAKPGPVPNLIVQELYKGGVLKFTCGESLSRSGPETIMCDGAKWSSEPPKCVAGTSLECDFEDDSLCGWSHDTDDDFDWTWNNGETPTAQTGPSFDHTTNSSEGHYLYMESSAPQTTGQQTRILSPSYAPTDMVNMCLEFYYHMLGPDGPEEVGGLDVYVKPLSIQTPMLGEDNSIFHQSGNQGDRWQRADVKIPEMTETFQIVFQATRQRSWAGDIAIDDVKIHSCLDETSTGGDPNDNDADGKDTDDNVDEPAEPSGQKKTTKKSITTAQVTDSTTTTTTVMMTTSTAPKTPSTEPIVTWPSTARTSAATASSTKTTTTAIPKTTFVSTATTTTPTTTTSTTTTTTTPTTTTTSTTTTPTTTTTPKTTKITTPTTTTAATTTPTSTTTTTPTTTTQPVTTPTSVTPTTSKPTNTTSTTTTSTAKPPSTAFPTPTTSSHTTHDPTRMDIDTDMTKIHITSPPFIDENEHPKTGPTSTTTYHVHNTPDNNGGDDYDYDNQNKNNQNGDDNSNGVDNDDNNNSDEDTTTTTTPDMIDYDSTEVGSEDSSLNKSSASNNSHPHLTNNEASTNNQIHDETTSSSSNKNIDKDNHVDELSHGAVKTQDQKSSSSTEMLPLIVGVASAVLVAAVVIAVLAYIWARNQRRKNDKDQEDQMNIITEYVETNLSV